MDAERQSEERCAVAACPGMSACLACPEDALEPSPPDEWSGPIWPGPECLVPRVLRDCPRCGWRRYAPDAGLQPCNGCGTTLRYVSIATADAEDAAVQQRTPGIAEGHVRARARKARWLSWLERNFACVRSRDLAERCLSPEAAVMEAVERGHFSYVLWIGARPEVSDGIWAALRNTPHDGAEERAAALRLLASPDWAALPWQREPDEWKAGARCRIVRPLGNGWGRVAGRVGTIVEADQNEPRGWWVRIAGYRCPPPGTHRGRDVVFAVEVAHA